MVKVKNLRKRMEKFNEAVNGLKERKQEMSKQVEELAASTDALMAKIKVSFSTGKPPKVDKPPFTSSSLQSTMMLRGVALFLVCRRVSVSMHNSTGVCFSMSRSRRSKAVARIVCQLQVSLFLGPKEREQKLFISFIRKSSTQQQSK